MEKIKRKWKKKLNSFECSRGRRFGPANNPFCVQFFSQVFSPIWGENIRNPIVLPSLISPTKHLQKLSSLQFSLSLFSPPKITPTKRTLTSFNFSFLHILLLISTLVFFCFKNTLTFLLYSLTFGAKFKLKDQWDKIEDTKGNQP